MRWEGPSEARPRCKIAAPFGHSLPGVPVPVPASDGIAPSLRPGGAPLYRGYYPCHQGHHRRPLQVRFAAQLPPRPPLWYLAAWGWPLGRLLGASIRVTPFPSLPSPNFASSDAEAVSALSCGHNYPTVPAGPTKAAALPLQSPPHKDVMY